MITIKPLSDFLSEYVDRNIENKYPPVAVGRYGIRTRESIYSKELAKDYSKNKLIRKNTLTVGMGSNQVDIGILSDDKIYSVSPAYHTYNINGINVDYLRYCLEHRNQDMFIRYAKRGSRQGKTIDFSRWLNYVIPVYSEEIQSKIVIKLNKISFIIRKREELLKLYDQLVRSLFIEMFGDPVENPKKWDIIQLHDRCDIVTGNTPAREKSEYYGNYIEWIKSDNINTDDVYLTVAEEYLSKKGLLVGRCVEAGSILMTCIAGSIGCIGNVGVANRKVAFNQQINAIVPNKDSNIFIYWLMVLSKKYIQGTVNMSLKGILSKGKLSELYFPFPPIELQHKFEKNAIVIDKSKLAVKKSLEELEILKKSLMQKYFA